MLFSVDIKYLIIAIVVIIVLVVIFFITYIANKKTPVPEGCEDIKISEEGCLKCGNLDCNIKKKLDLKKIEEELNKEE